MVLVWTGIKPHSTSGLIDIYHFYFSIELISTISLGHENLK